jgi:ribonuclease P/MRP protein subunit POP3
MSEYRSSIPEGRGKRRRREQRKLDPQPEPTPPEPPKISSYITCGINETTSSLEKCSAAASSLARVNLNSKRRPTEEEEKESLGKAPEIETQDLVEAVFVCTSDGQPSELHAHLPVLCKLASQGGRKPVKLVPLPKGAETRLAAALGLPRVSVVGLKSGAENSDTLMGILGTILDVYVPWLEDQAVFKETKVKVVMSAIPAAPKKGANASTAQKQGTGKSPEKKGPLGKQNTVKKGNGSKA